jgi:hypothetical protein
VHFTTISTYKAIWKKLPTTQLPQPIEEGWKKKEEEFHLLRQFPVCPGPPDGKHHELQRDFF